MAIYHFSGQVISRSQGRSSVACAAYRAGACLEDERTGITHDFTQKQDVLHAEIFLPQNAPEWMGDRSKLWNTVEASEKRKDAQLAREFEITLPRELSNTQNIELAREFVQKEFVARGMVADLAFHNHKGADGEMQPHAHVMLTMREVTPDGFGQKVRAWNDKNLLLEFREAWAEMANHHLALHGYDQQIDHRSNVARGIDLEPQTKIGAAVVQEKLKRFEDHQRIAKENGERILADPVIALDAITQQQSTFTHHDLARFVNRHTLDAEQFQHVFDAVRACPEMVHLGQDEKGRDRYSTQTVIDRETRLVAQSCELHEKEGHAVSAATQSRVLSGYTLSNQQKDAFQHLTARGDIKSVVGYAGSGKSYLLGAAREAWEAEGYRVHGAALAGIAAQNLSHSSGIESRTLASRFYYWDKGEQRLTNRDILVVDEAGMIGSRQMARLVEEVHRSGAKLVLIGDPQQLQAIEAGGAFRAILERTHYVELTDIRRQREKWQQEATKDLARGDVALAFDRYRNHNHVREFQTQAHAKQALVEHWNEARINRPHDTHILLAYTRQDVQELNTLARDFRTQLGELGEGHVFKTERGERTFSEQDRLYFLQNNREMGVMNGSLGTIQHIDPDRNVLTVKLDPNEREPKPRTVTVDLNAYANIDHGYAATTHKAQGVTVDRSYLLASKHLDAHASYVGLTRHRESVDVFWSREEFQHERDLVRALGRERHKDMSIDYGREKPFEESLKKQCVNTHGHVRPETPMQQEQAEASLQAFMQSFRENNPEKARQLEEALRPQHEQDALSISRKWESLQKDYGNAFDKDLETVRKVRGQLVTLASEAFEDKKAMQFLREHDKETAKEMGEFRRMYGESEHQKTPEQEYTPQVQPKQENEPQQEKRKERVIEMDLSL